MKLFVFASAILLTAKVISADDDALFNVGPVVKVMENLADNTVEIIDEIHASLEYKIERSADDMLGNIQVITANAMEQLSTTFYSASLKLTDCPQLWSIQELQTRIDEQLRNCTSNLYNLRTVFTNENGVILQGIQTYVTELANIPAYCELLNDPSTPGSSFASSTACFVNKLVELNQNVGQLISQVNTSLVRTRKLGKTEAENSMECTSRTVEYFVNFLNESLKNC